MAVDTYRENVAYLHRDCEIYRAEGFQALAKVEVRANGRRVLATLNVVDDPRIVRCNEIGLSIHALAARAWRTTAPGDGGAGRTAVLDPGPAPQDRRRAPRP